MIPYTEWGSPEYHDIFVYLRPETNGILVESALLQVIHENELYKKNVKLAYLANLPGDFITNKKVIERHYKVKLYFTLHGKQAFTPYMKKSFEDYFHLGLESAKVIGAFEAMKILDYDSDKLFNIWVERKNMFVINSQSVKKFDDLFIINYDIPAILNKNNNDTDIAVMLFRTNLDYVDFYGMIAKMEMALKDKDILGDKMPVSRAFHYSKGPFEQLLDARGYLYDSSGISVPIESNSFYKYLISLGYSDLEIKKMIDYPIMRFCIAPGFELEDDLKVYTAGDTYKEAADKILQAKSQYLLDGTFSELSF